MKVFEVFASIQGEGRFAGMPMAFVRLAGCNMRCRWCDTPKSLIGGEEKTVENVVSDVEAAGLTDVCITGGEPMLQRDELRKLIGILKNKKIKVILETNGSVYDRQIFDVVDAVACDMKPPSSGEKSDEGILRKLKAKDYVKVVVADDCDLEYAKKVVYKSPVEVFLQPTETKKLRWLAHQVLKEKIRARVLPQMHKIIGVR